MPIDLQTKNDTLAIVGFADEVAALYRAASRTVARIQTYIDAAAAVAGGTATERQATFAAVVQANVSADDLTRIGALQPTIAALIDELETNYSDFIHLT